MANYALALSLGFVLLQSTVVLATNGDPSNTPILPKMSEIIDAQFQCNFKKIEKYPWDKSNRDIMKLAHKVWEVVKDVKIEPRSPTLFPAKNETEEGYTLSLTAMATFRCGESAEVFNNGKGEFYKTLPVISTAKNKQLFDFFDDDRPPREVGDRLMVNDAATDAPSLPGKMGFMCLVKYEDFIRRENAINLQKICANESKAKIAFTKKEIKRVRDLLRK